MHTVKSYTTSSGVYVRIDQDDMGNYLVFINERRFFTVDAKDTMQMMQFHHFCDLMERENCLVKTA